MVLTVTTLLAAVSLPAFFMAGCSNNNTGPAAKYEAPINLNSDSSFVVLAYTQITNAGPTNLCGNLGLSPGSSAGGGYTFGCSGTSHVTDSAAAQAQVDLTLAYNDAAGRTSPPGLGGRKFGGKDLLPRSL